MLGSKIVPCFLVFLALAGAGQASGVTAPATVTGTWRSRLALFSDEVRFELLTEQGSKLSLTLDPREVDGLNRSALKTTGAPLAFGWACDAATLRFAGTGRWLGRPSGTFSLAPDPDFIELLASVGLPEPSASELLRLALEDVPRESVVALREAGYTDLRLDDLVTLRNHGVTTATVRELAQLGLSGIPVDDLIRFRNHGIDARWLRGMAEAGFPPSEVDGLVQLRIQGLDPDEVAEMRAIEGFDLSADDLVELWIHGVDARYFADVAGSGNRQLTVDGIRKLHLYGVTADSYRAFDQLGYGDVDRVIELTVHGVEPEFVRELVEAGHDDLSVDQLIELRITGGVATLQRKTPA